MVGKQIGTHINLKWYMIFFIEILEILWAIFDQNTNKKIKLLQKQ